MKNKRGYVGIGIYFPKTTDNMGTLWRSAYLYDVDFIFTIGQRYKKQPTDTKKAVRHIPLFNFKTYNDFLNTKPEEAEIIIIEQGGKPLQKLNHPKSAIYILGSEDKGFPKELQKGKQVVEIESNNISSLNVATAGTVVLYERYKYFLEKNITNPTIK